MAETALWVIAGLMAAIGAGVCIGFGLWTASIFVWSAVRDLHKSYRESLVAADLKQAVAEGTANHPDLAAKYEVKR